MIKVTKPFKSGFENKFYSHFGYQAIYIANLTFQPYFCHVPALEEHFAAAFI